MSAAGLEATLIGYTLLRDGTLRSTIDFEPRHISEFHQAFLELPLPIFVLRDARDIIEIPKGGQMAMEAGMLCQEEDFQTFVSTKRDWLDGFYAPNEDNAATYVRDVCEIGSRIDLDHNRVALTAFHGIRDEFYNWSQRDKDENIPEPETTQ